MGLPRFWLDVADLIGIDAFLAFWRRLDAEPTARDHNSMMRVEIRRYDSWLRYQRNRYIQSMNRSGLTTQQIAQAVRANLGEEISVRHVARILKRR